VTDDCGTEQLAFQDVSVVQSLVCAMQMRWGKFRRHSEVVGLAVWENVTMTQCRWLCCEMRMTDWSPNQALPSICNSHTSRKLHRQQSTESWRQCNFGSKTAESTGRHQVTPALQQLHWLPIEHRITYKLSYNAPHAYQPCTTVLIRLHVLEAVYPWVKDSGITIK